MKEEDEVIIQKESGLEDMQIVIPKNFKRPLREANSTLMNKT